MRRGRMWTDDDWRAYQGLVASERTPERRRAQREADRAEALRLKRAWEDAEAENRRGETWQTKLCRVIAWVIVTAGIGLMALASTDIPRW